jgi:hypothetical protein
MPTSTSTPNNQPRRPAMGTAMQATITPTIGIVNKTASTSTIAAVVRSKPPVCGTFGGQNMV